MTSTRLAVTLLFSIFLNRLSVLIMTELRLRASAALAIEIQYEEEKNKQFIDRRINWPSTRCGFHVFVYMRFDGMDHQHFFHCILFVWRSIANWCRHKLHVLFISYAACFCIFAFCIFEPMCGKTKHPFSFYARRECATTINAHFVSLSRTFSQCKTTTESNLRVRHRFQTISGLFVRLRFFKIIFSASSIRFWRIISIRHKLIHLFWTVPLPHRR